MLVLVPVLVLGPVQPALEQPVQVQPVRGRAQRLVQPVRGPELLAQLALV